MWQEPIGLSLQKKFTIACKASMCYNIVFSDILKSDFVSYVFICVV